MFWSSFRFREKLIRQHMEFLYVGPAGPTRPPLAPVSALVPDDCGSVGRVLSHNRKLARLLPAQGTCLGCGFGPWSGCEQQVTNQSMFLPQVAVSLLLFPSLTLKNFKILSLRLVWYIDDG